MIPRPSKLVGFKIVDDKTWKYTVSDRRRKIDEIQSVTNCQQTGSKGIDSSMRRYNPDDSRCKNSLRFVANIVMVSALTFVVRTCSAKLPKAGRDAGNVWY